MVSGLARWESCCDAVAAAAAVALEFRPETGLVLGPESVSYETSRLESWTALRDFLARSFL